MSHDFDTPALDQLKTDITESMRNGAASTARMNYEADSDTNVPDGAVQFNRTDSIFEQLVSGIWTALGLKSAGLDADAASRSTLLMSIDFTTTSGAVAATVIPRKAGISGNILELVMPKDGKITHLSLAAEDALANGSMSVIVYKNNSTTSQSITLSTPDKDAYSQLATPVSFVAGDRISIFRTQDASFSSEAGTGAHNVIDVWGHFTE